MSQMPEEYPEKFGEAEREEMTLEDRYVTRSVLSEPMPQIHPSITPALGVPAQLCDETLLREIAAIPQKMGFKIGEAADLIGVKQYVLRYWETEFDFLKPQKARNNQRYYTRKDVENALLVRKLLHRDRFSIEGAKSALKNLKGQVKRERQWSDVQARLHNYHDMMLDLLSDLGQLKALFQ